MSTLAEIEAAIATLPAAQVEELMIWLNTRHANASIQNRGKNAVSQTMKSFIGRFAGGVANSANNESIEADLAREATTGLS